MAACVQCAVGGQSERPVANSVAGVVVAAVGAAAAASAAAAAAVVVAAAAAVVAAAAAAVVVGLRAPATTGLQWLFGLHQQEPGSFASAASAVAS